jgi:hypothetical protein
MHALRGIACQMYKIIATRFNTAHWKDSEMTEEAFWQFPGDNETLPRV